MMVLKPDQRPVFEDRRLAQPQIESVDVVIPLLHAPENFKENIYSYYSDVSINHLIIGNAGVTKDKLDFLRTLPRVLIVDHTKIHSQGYSLQLLFDLVKTDWFIYFHSDVSIPEGWYDEMITYKCKYDFYESRCIDPYDKLNPIFNIEFKKMRAYSGAQIGRTEIFKKITKLEDDYVVRTEDLFFQQEIQKLGYRYGKIPTIYHYHHVKGKTIRDPVEVAMETLKATIKYFNPDINYNKKTVLGKILLLKKEKAWDTNYWQNFANLNNPDWLPKIKKFEKFSLFTRITNRIKKLRNTLNKIYSQVEPLSTIDRINTWQAITRFLIYHQLPKKLQRRGKKEYSMGDFLLKDAIVKNESGLKFLVRKGQPDISYIQDSYEYGIVKILNHHLKESDVFVDIGSHIGKYVVLASKLVNHVICVDAIKENTDLLKKNFTLNNITKHEIYNIAISDHVGNVDLRLKLSGYLSGVSQMDIKEFYFSEKTVTVPCITMDALLIEKLTLKKINWLIMDIEGAEAIVLKHGQKTLDIIENIIIECHTKEIQKKIIKMLESKFIIQQIYHNGSETPHIWAKKRV